ncbi:MAG: hypothetical protein NTU97_03785 [Candidatus Magasanikbacteria bacterium]|nr:hypothetical protein [Candidatus Magasanikbacteria bacterium]
MVFSEEFARAVRDLFPDDHLLHQALNKDWVHNVERALKTYLKATLDPEWIVRMFEEGAPDLVLQAAKRYKKIDVLCQQAVDFRVQWMRDERKRERDEGED